MLYPYVRINGNKTTTDMTTQEINKEYTDLYGDLLTDVIKLKENPSFKKIKSYFSDADKMERTFMFNGKKVVAKRKFTHKGGGGKMYQIKTNYLHVWIEKKANSNSYTHMRECKDGGFKTV